MRTSEISSYTKIQKITNFATKLHIFIASPKIELFEQLSDLNSLNFDGESKYMHQINTKPFFRIVSYFFCEKYHCGEVRVLSMSRG